MAHRFLLPDIGEGLEEAEVVEWLVAVGDVVARDQPLVEVLTDKASSELPSPVAGTVLRLGAAEGERIQVGEVLIEIDDGSDGGQDALRPADTSDSDRRSRQGLAGHPATVPGSWCGPSRPPGIGTRRADLR